MSCPCFIIRPKSVRVVQERDLEGGRFLLCAGAVVLALRACACDVEALLSNLKKQQDK